MRFLALAALAGGVFLAGCAAPAPTTGVSTGPSTSYVPPPEGGPGFGPGDYCASTYVIVSDNARTNFSLGAENYRNDDYCAAYPYMKWLLKNDPLFTGEDPDDRNFLRMASIYEAFAAEATDEAEKKAYLDSSLTARAAGRRALDEAGIAYDSYLRDLREGFFYFQNAQLYPDDAEEKQFDAFTRAFEAKPDSLDDWYIGQLFNASALKFEDRAARADYVERLAQYVDDPSTKTYYTGLVEYLRTEPVEAGIASSDTVVEGYVADLKAGRISDDNALSLLAVILQQPERLEELGEDVAALQSQVLRLPAITNRVDNPRTLVALAFQAFREGDSSRGNQLFDQAIAKSASNSDRANLYYARAQRGYGSKSQLVAEGLRYQPSNGPLLYLRAQAIGDAVGRPSSTTGRAAYWCLADIYRNVAASSSDSRIAAAARRAAAQYERAGPSREQYFLDPGWRPGQTVTASLGSYGSCTTRVR